MSEVPPFRSIWKVEALFRPGDYITHNSHHTFAKVKRDLVFEGVDGDEEANTVTYWYRNLTEDDEG